MASNLRVDTILPSTGTTLGIGTASGTINFLGNSNIVTSGTLTAASASITGNLGVGGVLTYEDVTNIDSVGVITARSGGYLDIRTGSSINTNATGSAASGTIHKNTNSGEFAVVSGGTGGNNHLTFYTSASAAPTEKLRIGPAGQLGIAGANYGTSGQVLTSQGSGSPIQWATISTPLVAYKAKEYARSRYSFSNGTWAEIDNAFRIVHTPAATGNTIIIHTQVYHTIADNTYGGFANVTDQGSGSDESMLGETSNPSARAKGTILSGNYYNEAIRQNAGGTIGLGSNLWGYHVTENTNAHTFKLFARMGSGTRYIGDNQPAQFMEMWEYLGNVMQ